MTLARFALQDVLQKEKALTFDKLDKFSNYFDLVIRPFTFELWQPLKDQKRF